MSLLTAVRFYIRLGADGPTQSDVSLTTLHDRAECINAATFLLDALLDAELTVQARSFLLASQNCMAPVPNETSLASYNESTVVVRSYSGRFGIVATVLAAYLFDRTSYPVYTA